jgi:DNA-binding transcriptional LysR family regulator
MASTPLNALNAFLAVGRQRSFTVAAASLGISPSALSQSIRQLEARLGVPLLTRTTRSVSLTDAGQRLLESAGPAVDQALAALKTAVARPGELTGRVRLSVPGFAVDAFLMPILQRFMALHPQVQVEVRVEDYFVDIVEQQLDAGIRLSETIQRDMVQVRLSKGFRFVVAGSPAYLKRRGTPQHPQDLLKHDCLSYRLSSTGTLYTWELERGKKQWRIPVPGTFISNNPGVLHGMAEAGLGLTYTSEPAVEPYLKRGTLRLVLEPYAAQADGFFLYFPSRSQVSPAFRAFVDVARKVTAERL